MLLTLLQRTGQLHLCLNKEFSSQNVNTAKVKKPWTMLLLKNTLVMQRLEAQKLPESYLEQECSEELTWVGREGERGRVCPL